MWNLTQGDPLALTLSADARLSQPNFLDDQIWELSLHGGEPAAVMLQSSLGLRVHWVRLFPRFIIKNVAVNDPIQFHMAPIIHTFFPNYLACRFFPVTGLETLAEYWLPDSRMAAGRITFNNRSGHRLQLIFEWVAQLNLMGDGQPVSPATEAGQHYLKGQFGDHTAVCFVSGNPHTSSETGSALSHALDLAPGSERQFTWAFVTHPADKTAYSLAKSVLNRRWDAEIARIERLNASQNVEITTGNEAWDAVLAFSQKIAFSLFYPANQSLPNASFVLSREPDHGYSLRGDGSDYPVLWKGQTALDALYLAKILLPAGVNLLKGILHNFLSRQEVSGKIDWRIGLAGDTSHRLAQPVLAALAWEIYNAEEDLAWLSEIYPALMRFIRLWFSQEFDRDGDGFPEWEHPLQTGLEDIPLYDRWHTHAQGVNITLLECPGLAAFLYQELTSLASIARLLNQSDDMQWLDERQHAIHQALQGCWDEKTLRYRYRDAYTHQSTPGSRLAAFQGSGTFTCRKHFPTAQRLLVNYQPFSQSTHPINVRIIGQTDEGEIVEEFPPQHWYWSSGKATTTSHHIYTSVKRMEITGISPQDTVTLNTIDYTQDDITQFLPLWAGMPSIEQAGSMLRSSLEKRFSQPYGIPVCLQERSAADQNGLSSISPLWNTFVIEGLLRYGYRDLAADIFGRIMDACTESAQTRHAFHEFYDAQTGNPAGERNHLHGLIPINLLLKLIGIKKMTKQAILLEDFSPFPWPITVKYQGVEIQSHPTHAVVTFPNGQSASVIGPGPHQISLLPAPLSEAPSDIRS